MPNREQAPARDVEAKSTKERERLQVLLHKINELLQSLGDISHDTVNEMGKIDQLKDGAGIDSTIDINECMTGLENLMAQLEKDKINVQSQLEKLDIEIS